MFLDASLLTDPGSAAHDGERTDDGFGLDRDRPGCAEFVKWQEDGIPAELSVTAAWSRPTWSSSAAVTLSNYERGVTVPTLIMLAELALRYGVDAVDLIRYAACHSKPDKRVQRLKVADPTLRATLTQQFVTMISTRSLGRKSAEPIRAAGWAVLLVDQ